MDVVFASTKLEKECNDSKLRRRSLGEERAKRLGRRLDDLRAAASLDEMRRLPGRCHELTADLKGLLALDLDGPYRLIFEVADDPVPLGDRGELVWSLVTSVRILRVENYHD